MAFEVVRKKRVIDLTKGKVIPKRVPAPAPVQPPEKAKPKPKPMGPKLIQAATDGPPIAVDLPENHRKSEPVLKSLTDKQVEILDRLLQKTADGPIQTIGLRLVLAASEDEQAAAWPIGALSKALHLHGRHHEGQAVYSVAWGCRLSRYRDMAASVLEQVNQRLGGDRAWWRGREFYCRVNRHLGLSESRRHTCRLRSHEPVTEKNPPKG
jgi:hypothetical protein